MADAQVRVLVVDDTTHVREMLAAMLTVDGFDVVAEVADGPAAVAAAAAFEPDVAVVDYKMPGVDGLETARQLRAVDAGVHIILYSAFVDETVVAAGAAAGVSQCLAKGDGLAALEQSIHALGQRSPRP